MARQLPDMKLLIMQDSLLEIPIRYIALKFSAHVREALTTRVSIFNAVGDELYILDEYQW